MANRQFLRQDRFQGSTTWVSFVAAPGTFSESCLNGSVRIRIPGLNEGPKVIGSLFEYSFYQPGCKPKR